MDNLTARILSIMVEYWDPLGLVEFKREADPEFNHLSVEDDYKPYAEKVSIALAKGADIEVIENMLEKFEKKSFSMVTDRGTRKSVAQRIIIAYEI